MAVLYQLSYRGISTALDASVSEYQDISISDYSAFAKGYGGQAEYQARVNYGTFLICGEIPHNNSR